MPRAVESQQRILNRMPVPPDERTKPTVRALVSYGWYPTEDRTYPRMSDGVLPSVWQVIK